MTENIFPVHLSLKFAPVKAQETLLCVFEIRELGTIRAPVFVRARDYGQRGKACDSQHLTKVVDFILGDVDFCFEYAVACHRVGGSLASEKLKRR